jgi:hypothetical protein
MPRRAYTEKELIERRARRHATREINTQYQNPNQVVTIDQWAKLAGFSYSTARRVLASGDGPPLLRISARRYGIRISDHLRWQERLAKEAAA